MTVVRAYSEDQPRDEKGQFASGGGEGKSDSTATAGPPTADHDPGKSFVPHNDPKEEGTRMAWKNSLTQDQKDSISDWMGFNFAKIRYVQSGGKVGQKPYGKEEIAQAMKDTLQWNSAVANAPVYKGTAYRGVVNMPDSYVANLKPGNIVKMEADASWSKSKGEARKFGAMGEHDPARSVVFEAAMNSGRNISRDFEEEVIGMKGSQYKILDVKPTDKYLLVRIKETHG